MLCCINGWDLEKFKNVWRILHLDIKTINALSKKSGGSMEKFLRGFGAVIVMSALILGVYHSIVWILDAQTLTRFSHHWQGILPTNTGYKLGISFAVAWSTTTYLLFSEVVKNGKKDLVKKLFSCLTISLMVGLVIGSIIAIANIKVSEIYPLIGTILGIIGFMMIGPSEGFEGAFFAVLTICLGYGLAGIFFAALAIA